MKINRNNYTKAIVLGIVLTMLCGLVWFAFDKYTKTNRQFGPMMRRDAMNKMRLGFSHVFESNSLPPAYQLDSKIEARTSWRILIELAVRNSASDVYRHYDTSLPWNSAKNLQTASNFSMVYYDPWKPIATSDQGIPCTDFVVISGEDTAFVGEQSFLLKDILDGPENTLLVVEILNSDIPWTEPRDIELNHLDQSRHYLAETETTEGGQICFEGQYLLFADLEIFKVLRPLPIEDFKALITPEGGEPTTRQQLTDKGYLAPH